MKPTKPALLVLLGLSLAANGWMAATWLMREVNFAEVPSLAAANAAASAKRADSVAQKEERENTAAVNEAKATKSAWAQLATDDLRELVRRLRTAGFPPAAVSAIVFDRVEERFRARMMDINGSREETPYWKSAWRRQHDPKKVEELNALFEEQQALLKQALGPAYWMDGDTPNDRQRRFGDLAPEKIEAIKAIKEEHGNRRQERAAAARAGGTAMTGAEMMALMKAERTALAQVLSPAELFEYEIRNDPSADQLLSDTQLLTPSEAEFRAMFPLYQQIIETMEMRIIEKGASADPGAVFREAKEQNAAKLREALGPERYADFVQASDPEQRKLNQIVQRLELPLSVARSVSTVQKDVTARADAVRANTQLSPEQRAAQLGALADEAKARITESLGSRGFGAYQRYSGRWLEMLQTSGGRNPQR